MSENRLDTPALLAAVAARARELEATDAEIARLRPLPEVLYALPSLDHTIEVVAFVCGHYAERPALGQRAYTLEPAPEGGCRRRSLPRFETLSYGELWRRCAALASGWRAAGLVAPGELVGLCGFGSPEFVIADLACLYAGAVSVPLQTTLAPKTLAQIIRGAELRCVVASRDQLELVARVVPDCPSLRSLGVIDWCAEDAADVALLERVRRSLAGLACPLWTLAPLEAEGAHKPMSMVVPDDGSDPLVTLLYTSGSTGVPKGAMYPDSLWREAWLRSARGGPVPVLPQLTVNYLPMNHLMGRGTVIATLVCGGLVHFTLAPDMSTLFEDIRLVRPTTLSLVPRVAEMIHQHFQIELVRRGASPQDEAVVEEQVMDGMRRTFLGDRLLMATIGSAPTPPEVLHFLERCFGVPILEGYGSTEAGVITFGSRIVNDAVLDYKLIDAPEAGCYVFDRPHPRGQLLVKSRWSVPGYYRSPEASRALYDDEGYLRTGDVVEDRGNGEIVWIGRVRDVIKLSQGEFVTLWRLEGLFASGGPLIRQIYLYGDSDRAYLLGVVVPDREAVSARLAGDDGEEAVKRLLRGEIERIAMQAELRPFEVPRDFLIEWTPFTKENGLLTESNKIARLRLTERYGDRLEALYVAIDCQQLRELAALRRDTDAPVAQKVRLAAQAVLGLQHLDLARRFADLGGDSLAAVQLATLLEELCDLRVPEGLILDPALTLADLARAIEQAAQERVSRPGFATVHGAGARTIRAADLRLEKFLAPSELAAAEPLHYEAPAGGFRTCLLTGASGFLGRFLTLALLERLPQDGRLVCLVRAGDDAAAEKRFRGIFEQAEPALRERFEALSRERLEVLAGDLMKPRLGLTEATFDRLSTELDLIVHNGALVNHAYSYAQLFEPNVLGTVEVIRLALRQRVKAIGYVSTVGVLAGARPGEPVGELPPEALWRERPIDSGYAVGYATSKWAGEVLLAEMQRRIGAPVGLFRPTMILAPERYAGEINAPDRFVRLLVGLVDTGLAPGSFYATEAGARPAFDGLPADFVARAIAAITFALAPGLHVYNVANPQGNAGRSLDSVVDWVMTAGYPIRRIDDYACWFGQFGDRLRALPEPERRHSPLPILESWAQPERPEHQTTIDNSAFRARMRALLGMDALPPLSEALVHKTLAGMVAHGLISRPARPGAIIWAPAERIETEGPR